MRVAAYDGHVSIVQCLVQHGADPNNEVNYSKKPIFFLNLFSCSCLIGWMGSAFRSKFWT